MCSIWLKKKRSREKKRELLLIVRWCWDAAAWSNKNLTDADIHTVYGGTGGIGTQGPSEQFWIWWGPVTSKYQFHKKGGKTITGYTRADFFSLWRKLLFWKNLVGINPNRPTYVPTGLHREQVSSCPVSCYSFVVSRIIFLHALHVSCAFCDVSMASRGFIRRLSLTIQERIT